MTDLFWPPEFSDLILDIIKFFSSGLTYLFCKLFLRVSSISSRQSSQWLIVLSLASISWSPEVLQMPDFFGLQPHIYAPLNQTCISSCHIQTLRLVTYSFESYSLLCILELTLDLFDPWPLSFCSRSWFVFVSFCQICLFVLQTLIPVPLSHICSSSCCIARLYFFTCSKTSF